MSIGGKNIYDFLVTSFGKFAIIYSANGMNYLKITSNNDCIQVNDEEKKNLNEIFDKKIDSYDCAEKYSWNAPKLEDLIKNNPDIANNENLINQLKTIEQLIPEDCRGNFYRNLASLKILYDQPIDDVAVYNGVDNAIKFGTGHEESTRRTLGLETIDPETLKYYMDSSLFHELLHMSSCQYDEQSETMHHGLATIKLGGNALYSSRALNEGVTEMLTHMHYPEILKNTGYLEEIAIAGHLASVVGNDTLLKSYFSSSGIEPIKKELYSLGVDPEEIDILSPRVEINHRTRHERDTSQNSALANLERTLLDCSESRLRQAIESGYIRTEEDLNNYFRTTIEPNLITSDKFPFFTHSIEKCLEMDQVDRRLEEIRGRSYQHYQTKVANDPYISYMNRMNQAYLDDGIVNSEFTFQDDALKCHHRLETFGENKERILIQEQTFDYNDDFRRRMLEPSIVDYAQRSPLLSADVVQNNQTDGLNNGNFKAVSQNDNVLSINNVSPDYANYIKGAINQIQPTVYNQQQALAMQNQSMQMSGQVMTKTMGGFVDALILATIVGFITGLGIWIGLMLIK